MTEHSPTPEHRYTDDELIDMSIDASIEMEEIIDSATARMIASQLHGGMASDLYSFSSTGAISKGLLTEIERAYEEFMEDEPTLRKIVFLSTYVAHRYATGDRGAKEGWHKLWLEDRPELDLCPVCHEPISRNHRVGCPLGVDDEDQLNRVIELGQEHGQGLLMYLDYRGFRSLEELEQVVQDFQSGVFYGQFKDLDTFRQHYDIGPEEYIEQTYHIAEGLHGDLFIFDR